MISGNLVDWWDPESKKRYLKKTQCIIEQYGNYTVEVCDRRGSNKKNYKTLDVDRVFPAILSPQKSFGR